MKMQGLETEVNSRELATEAKGVIQQARALIVNDSDSYLVAGALRDKWVERAKQAETFMRPRIQEADRHHKNLVSDLKKLKDPFESAAKTAKQKMIAYDLEAERQRAIAQAKIDAEVNAKAEADALELAVELEKAGATQAADEVISAPVEVQQIIIPKATPKVEGFRYRTNWTFEIVNADLIPREWLIPDVAKIGAVVRALKSATNIAGIRVIEQKI